MTYFRAVMGYPTNNCPIWGRIGLPQKTDFGGHNFVKLLVRAGEMVPEVGWTRPWGPREKGSPPKCLKGSKTTYTTIAIAEKQSKRSEKGLFSLYIGPLRVPPRKWNQWGPEGKVPPGPPRFLQPCSSSHFAETRGCGCCIQKPVG